MKIENIALFVKYHSNGHTFAKEKGGRFETSTTERLAAFMLLNSETFTIKRNKISTTFKK